MTNAAGTGGPATTGSRPGRTRERRRAIVIAVIGVVLTTAYAAAMLLQILVWNPLAAAPTGLTLPEVYATMEAAGQWSSGGQVLEFAMAGVGIALSIGLLGVTSATRRPRPLLVATLVATIIAFGAPAYFWTSFSMGMSLADTFYISGADASPGALPLYAASGLAAVAAFVLALQPGTRAPVAPTPRPA